MTRPIPDFIKKEMADWQQARHAALTHPNGFLSLTGLHWLKTGINRFGSDSSNDCQFHNGLPAKIGVYTVSDDGISVTINDGVEVTHEGNRVSEMDILADRDLGGPTILEWGSSSWFVIRRDEALALRVRDSEHPTLREFKGVERFEYDLTWRLTGRFEPHPEPKTVPIPSALGGETQMISPGMIEIGINGESHRLLALLGPSDDQFFLVIADGTSGKESYGGGRFLTTELLQADGSIVIDFNKAINPPCAFTPFATCPLPPEENRLEAEVLAGEKVFRR